MFVCACVCVCICVPALGIQSWHGSFPLQMVTSKSWHCYTKCTVGSSFSINKNKNKVSHFSLSFLLSLSVSLFRPRIIFYFLCKFLFILRSFMAMNICVYLCMLTCLLAAMLFAWDDEQRDGMANETKRSGVGVGDGFSFYSCSNFAKQVNQCGAHISHKAPSLSLPEFV